MRIITADIARVDPACTKRKYQEVEKGLDLCSYHACFAISALGIDFLKSYKTDSVITHVWVIDFHVSIRLLSIGITWFGLCYSCFGIIYPVCGDIYGEIAA